ncbi:hypothetical protein B0H16DRAFT_1736002 [Mycena metata]|uniref:Uncharacterized protein n=1 Tax=Mycena metata TaxID=1033252 RepID=A0AAD7MNX9_9AGAR|nr:hypothetical protein B0H16DRAFT_1736002 [Mycena metata]
MGNRPLPTSDLCPSSFALCDEQPGRRARNRPQPGSLCAPVLLLTNINPNPPIDPPRRGTAPAAWALVVPLLSHPDPNIQFFDAHTAHAKIARGELASLSAEGAGAIACVSKIGGGGGADEGGAEEGVWGGCYVGSEGCFWLEGTVRVSAPVAAGVTTAYIHEFLAREAEDVGRKREFVAAAPAQKIFEELRTEKEKLGKAVASLNTVRGKGKSIVNLLEIEDEEETE